MLTWTSQTFPIYQSATGLGYIHASIQSWDLEQLGAKSHMDPPLSPAMQHARPNLPCTRPVIRISNIQILASSTAFSLTWHDSLSSEHLTSPINVSYRQHRINSCSLPESWYQYIANCIGSIPCSTAFGLLLTPNANIPFQTSAKPLQGLLHWVSSSTESPLGLASAIWNLHVRSKPCNIALFTPVLAGPGAVYYHSCC